MKKKLCIFMAALMLLTPTLSFAENNNKTENLQEENVEIRNQDIYVPTNNGVQRATYEEAVRIDKYNSMPLEEITDSYLLGDFETGRILKENNIDEVHAMASTSKLVSLFVIMDKIEEEKINLDDIVEIDHESAVVPGSSYKLKEGDKETVDNLLKAAFVISGNDAITALGKYVAGSKEGFVNMMNKKCKELGLENAYMVNPTGLTDYEIEDYNKMTTREMFKLARALIKEHPEVIKYSSEKSIKKANDKMEYNTNPLLGVLPEVDGLKTGYTNAAGRCLIATGKKTGDSENGTSDYRLIGITTGSRNDWQRYSASRRLMENGFKDYINKKIGNTDEIIDTINIENASKKEINLYLEEPFYNLQKKDENIEKDIIINKNLEVPIEEGAAVGKVIYYSGDDEIYKTNLVVHEKVYEKGFIFKIQAICENIFENIKEAR